MTVSYLNEYMYNTEQTNCYVYCHCNPVTMQPFYIGMGSGVRANDFRRREKRWIDYVKKHGKPVVRILFDGLTRSRALDFERVMIALYGRRGIDEFGVLVNLVDGGDAPPARSGSEAYWFGKKRSYETRKKISETRKSRKYVRVLTPEQRMQISERQRGEKSHRFGVVGLKHPRSKPVIAIERFTGICQYFESSNIAAKELGLIQGSITAVLKGHHGHYNRYFWIYADE